MKALGLLSGGLDSVLAFKLILNQGIKAEAIKFVSPFFDDSFYAKNISEKFGIPLKIMYLGKEYLKLIKNPKHGYGSGMNPCIDCHVFMLKKAKQYAKKIKADFIFTGDVLGERPMSQNMKALNTIESEARLKNKILRPLSAKLLPETVAEKNGWVDRNKLLDIKGRSRKKQLELAKKFKIKIYASPGGGCLLTEKEFSAKLRDLIKHKKRINEKDIELLKIGRHFRFKNNKIIVGRNEKENELLKKLRYENDYLFEVSDYPSPLSVLQGPKTKEAIKKASGLTVRYSDAKGKNVLVKYGKNLKKSLFARPVSGKIIEKMRIKS